jgi:hypothetical protein
MICEWIDAGKCISKTIELEQFWVIKETRDDVNISRDIDTTGMHNCCGILFKSENRRCLLLGSVGIVIRASEFI